MVERIQNLDDLKVAIQSIIVKDYGDFKRKLVLYISRFQEAKSVSAEDKKRFALMIDRIQFHPIMDIESTRSWALDQLNQLH
jgi:hypothetical protein